MIRLGIAPRFVDFSRGALATIDQWFNTVTARLNIYPKSGLPVLTDVPESQWGLFRDTTSGKVYISANSAGTLKSQEIGATSAGTGNVVGPASSTVGNVALFSNTTGTLLSDSGKTMSAAGVGLGNVTNDAQTKAAIVPNTAPTAGQILVGGNATGIYNPVTMASDGQLSFAGNLTVVGLKGLSITGITGLLKLTGGSPSQAVAGTDYVVPGGALGTPSSGTLTNCTGLPISTGVSGLGGGVAAFLATPSSANLATAVTDETGSGALVFGTAPTISNVRLTTTTFMSVTAPASLAAAATLTAAQLLASLIQYTGAAAALTLPTGTLMDAAITSPALSTDQGFDFYVINTGSGAATMTAGTGFTIVGSATVTNGTSAHYRARRTAANTYVAYRVS